MATNTIKIKFCNKCKWFSRAVWIMQEIFNTYENDISKYELVPADHGLFEIYCNENLIFSRKEESGFLEIKIIKQRIRDVIDPNRELGHNE